MKAEFSVGHEVSRKIITSMKRIEKETVSECNDESETSRKDLKRFVIPFGPVHLSPPVCPLHRLKP